MKLHLKLSALAGLALALVAGPVSQVKADDDQYFFKVHNTTKETITKLLASEDGKSFGNFDLGKEGIPAGKTVTLNWDKKTNDKGCEWYFKAVFGSEESEAKKFDFCEEDLELEF